MALFGCDASFPLYIFFTGSACVRTKSTAGTRVRRAAYTGRMSLEQSTHDVCIVEDGTINHTQLNTTFSHPVRASVRNLSAQDVIVRFSELHATEDDGAHNTSACGATPQEPCALCGNSFHACLGHVTYYMTRRVIFAPSHLDRMRLVLDGVVSLYLWHGSDACMSPRLEVEAIGNIGVPLRECHVPPHAQAVRYSVNTGAGLKGDGRDTLIRCRERDKAAHAPSPFHMMYTLAMHDMFLEQAQKKEHDKAEVARIGHKREELSWIVTHVVPVLPVCQRPKMSTNCSEAHKTNTLNDFYKEVSRVARMDASSVRVAGVIHSASLMDEAADQAQQLHDDPFRPAWKALEALRPWGAARDAKAVFEERIQLFAWWLFGVSNDTMTVLREICRAINNCILDREANGLTFRELVDVTSKCSIFDTAAGGANADERGRRQLSQRFYNAAYFIPLPATGGSKQTKQQEPGFISALKGKEGMLRAQCCAKRLVGMFGRTVITPGYAISCLEAKVPRRLMQTVTQPFVCRSANADLAMQLLNNGSLVLVEHAGEMKAITAASVSDVCVCGSCTSCVSTAITKAACNPSAVLSFRRTMMTGDMLIVNRQPSISHRSMQALKVHSCVSETLSLPVQICTQFNADFDGDEMNQFVPNSMIARAEARYLMMNTFNWSENVVLLQDIVHGLYLLARDHTRLTPAVFGRLVSELVSFGLRADSVAWVTTCESGLYTGFDMLRLILHVMPDFPLALADIFPGSPAESSPMRRHLRGGAELVMMTRGEEMMGPNTPDALKGRGPWTSGRIGANLMLYGTRLLTLESGCAAVAVAPYTVLRLGDTYVVVTRTQHIAVSSNWQVEVTVVGEATALLSHTPCLAICAYTGLGVTPDGVHRTPLDTPVRITGSALPVWVLEPEGVCNAPRPIIAGEPHVVRQVTQRHVAVPLVMHPSMLDFPVTKSALRGSLCDALALVDSTMATRILDAMAHLGPVVCDMFGSSLAIHDLLFQCDTMRSRTADAIRKIGIHAMDSMRGLAAPNGGIAVNSRYVLAHERAYDSFTRDVVSACNALIDTPIKKCAWSGIKAFTNGSKAKGDEGKLREMVCAAGLRDVNQTIPYGDGERVTHYNRRTSETGVWDPLQNGLIASPYLVGIPAESNFFESQTCMINTAASKLEIKAVGYTARKITMSLLDLSVTYDYTLRGDGGDLISTYVPTFQPDKPRIDIKRMYDFSSIPRTEEPMTDQAITDGLLSLLRPNGEVEAMQIIGSITRSRLDARQRAFLYWNVRRMAATSRVMPGWPFGIILSEHINNKCQQDVLDTFHNTGGKQSSGGGVKGVLEQQKHKHNLMSDMRDPWNTRSTIKRCVVSARVNGDEDQIYKAYNALYTRTFRDVIQRVQVVVHPWVAQTEPDRPTSALGIELWDALCVHSACATLRGEHTDRTTFFTTTLRLLLRPSASLRDTERVIAGIVRRLSSKKNRRYAWYAAETACGGLAIRLCVIDAKIDLKRKRREDVASEHPSTAKDDVHEDDDEDDEDGGARDSDEEGDDEEDTGRPSARRTPSKNGQPDAGNDDAYQSASEEEEEGDEQPTTSTHKDRNENTWDSETAVLNALMKFATKHSSDNYAPLTGEPPVRIDLTKRNTTGIHKFLDGNYVSGIKRTAHPSLERHEHGATILAPCTRIERLIAEATGDVLLTTVRSTMHANNIDVLGIEAATRIMRTSLYKMWPEMPRFYVYALCEFLSFSGTIIPVNNNGVISTKGFISQICFEQASKTIRDQKRPLVDNLTSHTSRVFMGLPVAVGTGLPSLYSRLV
jgi:hypothetical protein